MSPRVAVTQPYVPRYRFALWDGVASELDRHGVAFRLFYGGDRAQIEAREARGDGVNAQWAEQVPTRIVRLSSRLPALTYRKVPESWRGALLLTEMQVSNANAWEQLARRRPYITMGHGKSYTGPEGAISSALETIQNRGSEHVLTYMESGRSEVIKRTRLPADRVTAFNNSTDTAALTRALASCSSADVKAFRQAHGIPLDARVALYVGALNEHKRVDVLAEAAKIVLSEDPRWWLVVAGSGPASSYLEPLRSTGRVIQLGYTSAGDLAPAALNAEVMVNPGRVGLVAVDALAMRLPLLTTRFPYHAPEIEYLDEGTTLFTSEASGADFANQWMAVRPAIYEGSEAPTLDEAVKTIAGVILRYVAQE